MTQQPPPGFGPPPYGGQAGYGGYGPRPHHPQATTVLVLGILGIVVCGVIAPFAWVMGNRVVREIDASGAGGRTEANIGRILGIVGSLLLILGLVTVVLFLGLGILSAGVSSR